MALETGPYSFTEARLKIIWRDINSPAVGSGWRPQRVVNQISRGGLPSQRTAEAVCRKLYDAAADSNGTGFQLEVLDECYGSTYEISPRRKCGEEQAWHTFAARLE
jgi:hypothetical protein